MRSTICTKNVENTYLPFVSNSVLTGVDYNDEVTVSNIQIKQHQSIDAPPPTEIEMKLSFMVQNQKPLTKEKIMEDTKMYFREFPLYQYDFEGKGQSVKLVTDILRRVAVKSKVKPNTLLFDKYDVKDIETPEIVADLYYRTTHNIINCSIT